MQVIIGNNLYNTIIVNNVIARQVFELKNKKRRLLSSLPEGAAAAMMPFMWAFVAF